MKMAVSQCLEYPCEGWLFQDRKLAMNICDKCYTVSKIQVVKEKLLEKPKENLSKIKELQASLDFLRHEFENDPTSGISAGDVVIIVQGATDQPLTAHKFILARRSSVFQKIFETEMQKDSGIIRIDDATLPVVRALVKFCYNAEIKFTDEVTSEAVFVIAHKYGIGLLRRKCKEDLIRTICKGNLANRLKLARKFDSLGLQVAACEFFKDNFDEVICDVLEVFC